VPTNTELTKDDFLCLLFIYCAYIDYSFSKEEKEIIINRFGTKRLSEMMVIYNENSESYIFRLLLKHISIFYPNAESASILKKELTLIFKADGKICAFEKSFLAFIDLHLSKR